MNEKWWCREWSARLGLAALLVGLAAGSRAAEELPPADASASGPMQELMQQAVDGEVAMPRVGTPPASEEAVPAVPQPDVTEPAPAVDGEMAVPRVRAFNRPNRALMKAGVANMHAGFAFLEENRAKPGVITLKSGLQYKVLKAGAGKKPAEQDVVKCIYRGTLIDNTVFEESPAGKAASIKVAALIPGLKEALLLMPVGARWQVVIPPDLGFGAEGNPPKVGPSAALIYDLELLGIMPPSAENR